MSLDDLRAARAAAKQKRHLRRKHERAKDSLRLKAIQRRLDCLTETLTQHMREMDSRYRSLGITAGRGVWRAADGVLGSCGVGQCDPRVVTAAADDGGLVVPVASAEMAQASKRDPTNSPSSSTPVGKKTVEKESGSVGAER